MSIARDLQRVIDDYQARSDELRVMAARINAQIAKVDQERNTLNAILLELGHLNNDLQTNMAYADETLERVRAAEDDGEGWKRG